MGSHQVRFHQVGAGGATWLKVTKYFDDFRDADATTRDHGERIRDGALRAERRTQ